MIRREPSHSPFVERARRSIGEITVAVALTLAALAFVISALKGAEPETALNEHPASHGLKPN